MIDTSWMKVWWIVYNKKLFEGKLQAPKFKVRDLKSDNGLYEPGVITMHSGLDHSLWHAILVHEMVHQWQDTNGKTDTHGASFQAWANRIRAELNLEIYNYVNC